MGYRASPPRLGPVTTPPSDMILPPQGKSSSARWITSALAGLAGQIMSAAASASSPSVRCSQAAQTAGGASRMVRCRARMVKLRELRSSAEAEEKAMNYWRGGPGIGHMR